MKKFKVFQSFGRLKLLLFSLLPLLLLSACTAEQAQAGAYSGTLVLEGRHVYSAGTTLPGALVVLGGEAVLEPGAAVDGPVYLMGGSLELNGTVRGDVAAIGGQLSAGPSAVVQGDLRAASAQEVSLASGAVVEGQVLRGPVSGVEPSDLFPRRSLGSQLPRILLEALFLAALASLIQRLIPGAVRNVQRAALRYWLVSAAMGLLAGLVGLVLLVVMAFTLILIPVTLLGFVLGFLAVGYGYAAIGAGIGRRLSSRGGLASFLGTFLLVLALDLVAFVPVVGGALGILAALVVFGAVLLTRFGLREFVPQFDVFEEDRE